MYSFELPSMTGNKCLSSDRNIWEYEDPAILPGWKVHSWQDRGNEEIMLGIRKWKAFFQCRGEQDIFSKGIDAKAESFTVAGL